MESWNMVYSWRDYKLVDEPRFELRDFTFITLGRDDDFQAAVNRFKLNAEKGMRELLRIDEWWGAGKSSFCYNLCYHINKDLFFDDKMEQVDSREKVFTHVLAIYTPRPCRLEALLDSTCKEGLSIPWRGREGKVGIDLRRKSLWLECVRKIAFIALLKAIASISKEELLEKCVGETMDRKDLFDKIINIIKLKTKDFIQKVDEIGAGNEDVYEILELILRYYMDFYMSPIDIPRHVRYSDLINLVPRLIWPVGHEKFKNSYDSLFNVPPGKGLNFIPAFCRLCRDAGIFLVVFIDEMERLPLLPSSVDGDLHDLAINALEYSSLTLVLIFRRELTEFLKKSEKRLHIYSTVYDGLRNFPVAVKITDIDKFSSVAINVTKEVLDIWRPENEVSSIFPFTEPFIRRICSHPDVLGFVRRYIRVMLDVLKWSLNYERPSVELTENLFDVPEVQKIIETVKKVEEEEAKKLPPE
jgi:hypothetical protein